MPQSLVRSSSRFVDLEERLQTRGIRAACCHRGFSYRASARGRGITRRQFVIGGLSLAALLAAGCGSDDDSGSDEVETRTVVHRFGETQVPVSPQRIVSVGWDEHDLILGFGYVPIMQRDAWGEQPFGTWPWAQPALGDAKPEVITEEELPYERILGLKPDLIMATWAGIDQTAYDRLTEIAPTVGHHPDYEDWETPWDARAIQVGGVFGKEEEARRRVQEIGDRIAKIRADHPNWEQMEGVSVTVSESTFSVATTAHSRGKLISDMGFKLPAEFADAEANGIATDYSLEELARIDRDLIVWVNGQDDSSNIANLPLRDTLTAHSEGREVYCDKVLTAAFSIQSLLSYNYLLDKLVPEIEAAVDGDPGTPVPLAAQYGIAP